MKRLIMMILMAAILLTGCTPTSVPEEGMTIYYRSGDEESRTLLQGLFRAMDSVDYDIIFQALKTPPAEERVVSYIPVGTVLEEASLAGGILYLELSPEYSTLTGVEQTLANSCITLTFCQISGVSGVSITSGGEPMSEQLILTPAKLMLTGGGGDAGIITAVLYYPTKEGEIGGYTQTITVEENRSAPEAILDQLSRTPESRELTAFLPQELSNITVWTEEDICYINLTGELVEALETGEYPLKQKLLCITNSICSLNSVRSVQFLQDGAVLERWQEIGGDFPLLPDYEKVVLIDTDE